ncbi:hypothetical protein TSAR_005406 [Trichomalopsis sarcophagae]|uniref:Reverse transcriptase domain-containing protein n=1 Tax=Trichomalopsis sarcophagae TaxID=543379 RepID=A0A232ERA4_9HYME|nr:hypothetical protein TSAR_005406 [Trichomalopsis sarcophagae]
MKNEGTGSPNISPEDKQELNSGPLNVCVYLDDTIVYAKTVEEHNDKFAKLLRRLKVANVKLQPDKCDFLRREVSYSGHVINEVGIRPDPKKSKHFSKIAKPLSNLLTQTVPFVWDDKAQEAFDILKEKLCKEAILIYPNFTKPFILTTDASQTCVGAVLSQGLIEQDRPVAYVSRVLNDAETRYDTYSREALAMPGRINLNADALSRNPIEESTETVMHILQETEERNRASQEQQPDYNTESQIKSQEGRPAGNAPKAMHEVNASLTDPEAVNTGRSETEEIYRAVEPTREREINILKEFPEPSEETRAEATKQRSRSYGKIFVECKEQLFMRKDNYLYFLTSKGTPCDKGARLLEERNELPRLYNLSVGELKITPESNKHHFIIIL